MKDNILYIAESVGAGHPDKICDIISDGILDLLFNFVKQKKGEEYCNQVRLACETVVKDNNIFLLGEYRLPQGMSLDKEDIINKVKSIVAEIGYSNNGEDFLGNEKNKDCFLNSDNLNINLDNLKLQSEEINKRVGDNDIKAGDQGIVVGCANNNAETEYMPIAIYYANKLALEYSNIRLENNKVNSIKLGADAKFMVGFNKDLKLGKLVASTMCNVEGDDNPEIRELLIDKLFKKCISEEHLITNYSWDKIKQDNKYFIQKSFIDGGPLSDSGLTGRKLMVDSYGSFCPHGGGAFSGKDPSKVDRSGAYLARYIAKNLVQLTNIDFCIVYLHYIIGDKNPFAIRVVDNNNNSNVELENLVREKFKDYLSVDNMIQKFKLLEPFGDWNYKQSAFGGHMGRTIFPWEKKHNL